ncbi:MAG: metallophosphoesterase family protein [Polyangiales bacterium]
MAILREREIPTIRGNHDRWALASGCDMRDRALSESILGFLRGLPTSWSDVVNGVRVVAWHARPRSDMAGIYADTPAEKLRDVLDEARADVLVVGHTHEAMALDSGDGRLVCNPGALLRDRVERDEAAPPESFGVLDSPSKTFTIFRADGRWLGTPTRRCS